MFAAELLMPEAAVRSAWTELVTDDPDRREKALDELIDVSASAMGWRLDSFALVQDRPA